jgi:hypothetical protein
MKTFVHKYFYRKPVIRLLFVAIAGVMLLVGTSFNLITPFEPTATVKPVKFYPNPATSYINFEFPAEIDKSYSLLIFSFVGKKMSEQSVDNSKLVVPLTGYYRGLYVFQLKDKTGRIVETGRFQVIQ